MYFKNASGVWVPVSHSDPLPAEGKVADDAAATAKPMMVGGKYSATPTTRHDGDAVTLQMSPQGGAYVEVTPSIETTNSAPVVGVKTVTATAAEVFAGASAKANRRKLLLKNESNVLRFRVGPSTVTQQNGFPVEPGAVVEFQFDPATAVAIYAIAEGASLSAAVMEV
jgi:hypothetical protein